MDRPISAASSSGTAPSTTTAPGHRRQASSIKNGIKPSGSTVISLFVTNLRLLNLDLLPDWPNITTSSFSNHDARTRMKCTEYALYQLFRLYDPATTADKLQPFFPPLEPLQSINLRAALFRCLNELKKSGMLSKETVLRKTMLDDCQGERFWEICLSFSAVVVRKSLQERQKRNRHGRPVAEKLGLAQGVSKTQRESMLPLAIAHRAALTKVLSEKQRKKETYARLYDVLLEKEDELRQRKIRAQEVGQRTKAAQPEKLKAVEQVIERSWVGSTDLKDALIEGDTCSKGDGMLLNSFDKFWKSDGAEAPGLQSVRAEIGLLQSLNDKATEQTARLRKWQNFHDRLVAAIPPSARSSRPASGALKGVRFNRHRDINPRDMSENDENQRHQQKRARHLSVTKYDEILTAMREELRKNSSAPHHPSESTSHTSAHPPKRAQTQPIPFRRSSLAIDASPGARDPHARSPSQTAVPVRSSMGRRVSSRSRSYQQPKVVSQREPIPLKSELFSPLKDKRNSSVSPLSGNSMLPSPVEEGEVELVDDMDGTNGRDDEVEREVKSPASPRDSGLGLKAENLPNGSALSSDGTEQAVEDAALTPPEAVFKVPELPAKRAAPQAARSSLAERTRQSLAFNSSDDITGFLPDLPSTAEAETEAKHPNFQLTSEEAPFDRRTSLLDRTRQSISMAPPLQLPKAKKSSHTRSRTSVYPINQFNNRSPGRERRSTVGVQEEEGSKKKRDFTPIEALLSPDAEYDSVFRSRPKIATSPVLSPRGEVDSFDLGGGGASPLVS
ncbi:hypothetical protein LTR37_017762 [Vermiconidia calcicola]|uniref:Uncharacterized protein n=1 Tax=Vermiconidia calcicola TaxID=1690605 RepID=A0ACC3MJ76_9PEZI|nr:hypothetical protein LTR37_017762 [Vermiconidia calcicola]